MELKFTDMLGRKRIGCYVECKVCKASFVTRIDQPATYCSLICARSGSKKWITTTCAQCKLPFELVVSKIKKSKSGLHFCSKVCKDKAQRLGGIVEVLPSHYGTSVLNYRRLFEEVELSCKRCGYDEFKSSVDIHHIDENRHNNNKENLMPLCKNCHQGLHCGFWKLEDL